MTTFDRKTFRNDPVMGKLFDLLAKDHKVPDYTKSLLFENEHIKDFCVLSTHFQVLYNHALKPLYVQYEVATGLNPDDHNRALVCIDSIGVYETFQEYEGARIRGLQSTTKSEGLNQN